MKRKCLLVLGSVILDLELRHIWHAQIQKGTGCRPHVAIGLLNLLKPNEISHSYRLDQSISVLRVAGWYLSV